MASMLDLCYLWYSCDTAWDICVIMWYLWWMCLIYTILLVWNVYMLSLWWWMWLLHKKQKKYKKNSKLCRVFLAWHSAKQPFFYLLENKFAECNYLATRRSLTLGKDPNFAECHASGTRRTLDLCRVPRVQHSAKFRSHPVPSVPFAVRPSRFIFFAECGVAHGKNLPSAREKALGIAVFAGRRKAVCASPSATLGDFFAECFPGFAECLWHSAK